VRSARAVDTDLAVDKDAAGKAELVILRLSHSVSISVRSAPAPGVKLDQTTACRINIGGHLEAMALGLRRRLLDLMISIATGKWLLDPIRQRVRAPWMAAAALSPSAGTVPGVQHYFGMIGDFADRRRGRDSDARCSPGLPPAQSRSIHRAGHSPSR